MIVLVGASASGKSTLQTKMIENNDNLKKIVTYTTRPPRANEKDGIDYHFVSDEKFNELLKEDYFVEHADYRGWHYGTAKNDCTDSNDCVAVLTPSGFRALKRLGVNVVSIYLHVDRRSLMMNILKRGDDIDEAYRRNLSDVGQFDGIAAEVDYVIDNSNYKMNVDEVLECINKIMGDVV